EQRGQAARRIKVLDFGVSKSLLEAQKSLQALTQTANMVGSPLYMSPEQLESSRDVDARADIWGLGVVLYELISGQPPFAANSIPQLIAAVINERPRRLAPELEVPPELEAAINRMLAKDRRERPGSVDELMDMLEPFAAAPIASGFRTTQLGAHGPTDRPRSGTPHGVRSTTRTSQTPLSWDRNDKSSGSRKRVAVGAVLIALAAVAAFVAYSYRGADAEPGVAKPLPQHSGKADVGTSAASIVEPDKDKEIPSGISPDSPPAEATPEAPAQAPQAQPAALPSPTVTEPLPKPAAAAVAPKPPVARPTQAPAVTPVPAPKPAAPSVHGAPPRGQISDFGGRR
ncbi:MAG TPA: protein kinase, partial [Polyangiales bacterium]|nr:protein kinase [Polyangiales bacterium]